MSFLEEPLLLSALPLDSYIQIVDPVNTQSQQVKEEKAKQNQWDVFQLKSDELNDSDPSDIFKTLLKLFKLIVYLLTFCIVLGCAVLSKGTLILMTSAIQENATFAFNTCMIRDDAGIDGDDYVVLLSPEERAAWISSLLLALFVPEILTFIRSTRICIFKRYSIPNLSTFLLVLAAETCHVVGVVLMLFIVFPSMDIMQSLTLTNAVCIVPTLVNFLSRWNTDSYVKIAKSGAVDLVTFLCQLSALVFYIYNAIYEPLKTEKWLSALSILLVSCAWWENFVSCTSVVFRPLENLKRNIDESRYFMYIFIPLWKMILILAGCTLCLPFLGEDIGRFFTHFADSFTSHNVTIKSVFEFNSTEAISLPTLFIPNLSKPLFPIIIASIHVASSYLCYSCGKFACKICIQGFSYALPISLAVPTTMCLLLVGCSLKLESSCAFSKLHYTFWRCPEEPLVDLFCRADVLMWLFWIVSQIWLTLYIWTPKTKRMASTNELFVTPMYSTALIDQSLALNRKKSQKIEDFLEEVPEEAIPRARDIPLILACATMWHETPDEMEQLLKSIMRMDMDQCLKRTLRNTFQEAENKDYYEMEAHIFFDDAFVIKNENDSRMVVNNFVKDLISAVDTATRKIYPPDKIRIEPPIKVPTPYGGRLIWKLQGDNVLVAHLKNKDLIRHKKRWSQVMYMYYLLGHRLMSPDIPKSAHEDLAKNTYILALDGDIDFKPDAVQLLVDLMERNENLGAACGRIHPVGTGMMVYYQKFEYAIGHWLQKATEHMIGCVLCSPGCFSLFRAEALMQDNVIRKYAELSKKAIEYVQFDQGEDRWLCTLLLQSGSKVEYSAASDAYTHCPESFAEFYTQRRRWAPSTMANIMDLLVNYRKTVECNDNISLLYIVYQLMLMVGTILGPGTIFLMLVGAMVSAFGISNWQSLVANFIPIAFFIIICFLSKNNTQILVAQVFSAAYALLMMAVLVGISLQLVTDGIASPTAIFLMSMTASFVIAAIAHPQEFWCVAHGLVYFLSVPSMYLLLTLYSITNLHVVSWGTREVATKKTKRQLEQEQLQAAEAAQKIQKTGVNDWLSFFSDKRQGSGEEEGSISFNLANLFRCMCCTYPKPDPAQIPLIKIGEQLGGLTKQFRNFQMQMDVSSKVSGFRRRSSLHGVSRDTNLVPVAENDEEEENEQDEINGAGPDEHMYNQIASSPGNEDEFWLSDPILQSTLTCRLDEKEKKFWQELISSYLYPMIENPEEKNKTAAELKELRNMVVFGILMLNALFILIVFLLQMQKETLHIEWPFGGNATIKYRENQVTIDFKYLQLEPINLILVFFFSIIVVIQFIAMLFHRFQTMSHILASTELNFCSKNSEKEPEILMEQLANVLRKLNLTPDDTADVDSNVRRRSTVVHNLHQKRQARQFGSLSQSYEESLKKIRDNDSKMIQRLRRLSKNNDIVGAVRRFSLSNRSTSVPSTPGSSMRQKVFTRDTERLERAFSNSPASSIRHSYVNKGFVEDCVDERESTSTVVSRSRATLEVPDPSRQRITCDIHLTPESFERREKNQTGSINRPLSSEF